MQTMHTMQAVQAMRTMRTMRAVRTLRAARAVALTLAALAAGLPAAGCHRRQPPPPRQLATKPAPRPALPTGMKSDTNLACELLTADDAAALLGGPVKPPITSVMADIGVVSWRCSYLSEASNPARVVTLLARKWQQADDARRAYEHAHALSQSISGQAPETVAGLGERAYWAGGTVSQLNVLHGDTWLIGSGTAAGAGYDQLTPARAAAAKILSHHR
jgi:hypothetical protein